VNQSEFRHPDIERLGIDEGMVMSIKGTGHRSEGAGDRECKYFVSQHINPDMLGQDFGFVNRPEDRARPRLIYAINEKNNHHGKHNCQVVVSDPGRKVDMETQEGEFGWKDLEQSIPPSEEPPEHGEYPFDHFADRPTCHEKVNGPGPHQGEAYQRGDNACQQRPNPEVDPHWPPQSQKQEGSGIGSDAHETRMGKRNETKGPNQPHAGSQGDIKRHLDANMHHVFILLHNEGHQQNQRYDNSPDDHTDSILLVHLNLPIPGQTTLPV
jgi:hypothetical protein